MFKDVVTAADINAEFKQANPGAMLAAQVLSSAFWPLNPPDYTFVYPKELETSLKTFETFYGKKFQGRRLRWLFSVGTCDLRATFAKGMRALFNPDLYICRPKGYCCNAANGCNFAKRV